MGSVVTVEESESSDVGAEQMRCTHRKTPFSGGLKQPAGKFPKAADWSRTSDLRFTKASLCQLSYGGGQSLDTADFCGFRIGWRKCSVGLFREQDLESSGFRFLSFAQFYSSIHASEPRFATLAPGPACRHCCEGFRNEVNRANPSSGLSATFSPGQGRRSIGRLKFAIEVAGVGL